MTQVTKNGALKEAHCTMNKQIEVKNTETLTRYHKKRRGRGLGGGEGRGCQHRGLTTKRGATSMGLEGRQVTPGPPPWPTTYHGSPLLSPPGHSRGGQPHRKGGASQIFTRVSAHPALGLALGGDGGRGGLIPEARVADQKTRPPKDTCPPPLPGYDPKDLCSGEATVTLKLHK